MISTVYRLRRPVFRLLVAVMGLWLSCVVQAQQAGLDIVLVLDSSGSMKQTDPRQLRIEAARLFVSLLRSGSRVGVISFSDQGYPVAGLTAVDAAGGRDQLYRAIGKVSSRGSHTNLHGALAKAQEMLLTQSSRDSTRHVVLLSDGRMDTGDTTQDTNLMVAIERELLPVFQEEDIHLHTVAFSSKADTALLNDLARHTEGLFQLAQRDSDLPVIYATLFERSENPNMLPIEGGRFVADSALSEVTILALKESAGTAIVLQAPDGRRHTSAEYSPDISWQSAATYDLITLQRPQPGTWQLFSSLSGSRAYVVTDLELESNLDAVQYPAGSMLAVEGWLARPEGRVELPELLAGTRMGFEMAGPQGAPLQLVLQDDGTVGDRQSGDGVFTHSLMLEQPGIYTLTITADGGTFQRRLVRHVEVMPVPPGSPLTMAENVSETAAQAEPAAEPAVVEPTVSPCPEPVVPAATDDIIAMRVVLSWFGAINLALTMLFGSVLGVWVVLRKRRARRAAG